jgi:hypothetical protein
MTTMQAFVLVSGEEELLAGMKSFLSNDLKILVQHNDSSYGSSLLAALKGLFPTKNIVTAYNPSNIGTCDAFIQDLNGASFSYTSSTFAVRFLHLSGKANLENVLCIPNVQENKTFFFFDRSRSLIKVNESSKGGPRSARITNVFDEEIKTRGSSSVSWFKKVFGVLDTLSPVLMDIEHFIQQLILSPSTTPSIPSPAITPTASTSSSSSTPQ